MNPHVRVLGECEESGESGESGEKNPAEDKMQTLRFDVSTGPNTLITTLSTTSMSKVQYIQIQTVFQGHLLI